ncbi:MAG: A/G-specific adenine glycosylase [Pirellulaceae bacterium]
MTHRSAPQEGPAEYLLIDGVAKRRFRRSLLQWFGVHARALPWRPSPGLYETWVSEIMLQQTQVATVVPYYTRFVRRFPHVDAVAAADEQELLRYWEGLGYYRRARHLHAAARVIVAQHGGQIPTSIALLRTLPGIGRYTGSAILSIALDQRHAILEANTVRLLSRLMALTADPAQSESQRQLWALAESLVPRRRCGDFNQALMELGSTICTPRAPQCPHCPIAVHCSARAEGLQEHIPCSPKKTTYTALHEAAVVIQHSADSVLLRQCGADERWAGMWDFPRFEMAHPDTSIRCELHRKVAELTGLKIRSLAHFATLKYGVTRFRITLDCYRARCRAPGAARDDLRWVPLAEIGSYPLSVTGRKITHLLAAPP